MNQCVGQCGVCCELFLTNTVDKYIYRLNSDSLKRLLQPDLEERGEMSMTF